MSAAFQMKRSAAPMNLHLIAGLSLAIVLCASALAVLLLGDPGAAAPRAVAAVPPAPPPPEIAIAEAEAPPRLLRGDEPAPNLGVLAPPPDDAVEVTLPGVRPIDEAAPVRTSRELAAAAAQPAGGNALPPAPLDGLTEPGLGGLLPVIGPDGRRPGDAYARPFQDQGLPRIALVIGGLGWDADRTNRAIQDLPPEVTLSFSPYADGLQSWIDTARAAGHEVLIEIPMEPFDYPENDPGEHTLLTSVGATANIGRLEWLMSRATGYFGVVNYLGEKFLASDPSLTPVLTEIAGRGLDMIYDGVPARSPAGRVADGAGLHWAATDRALDAGLPDVQSQLAQLEALALENGAAMGFGIAYPVVIDQVIAWTEEAERRGYAIAPASAVLDIKAGRRAP